MATVPPGSSTVEITLEPDGEGTRLRLVHCGLPPRPAGRTARGGSRNDWMEAFPA